MKVSTTLCTLSLYTMALGAPIPMPNSKAPINPTTSIRDMLHRIPSSFSMGGRMGIKDFFRHHVEHHPVAPSHKISPSAHRPLSASYFIAVASGSKPQVSIPEMEQSSTVRAETGSISKINPTTVEQEIAGSKHLYRFMPCRTHGGKEHYHLVRQYADMVVVGVLAIFLMLVAVVELWSPASERLREWRNQEGSIRLGDEEKTPFEPVASPATSHYSVPQLSTLAPNPTRTS